MQLPNPEKSKPPLYIEASGKREIEEISRMIYGKIWKVRKLVLPEANMDTSNV